MLIAEPGAGPAHAADHLVDGKQDVVFLADFLNPLPIPLRRHDHAAPRRHGFKDQTAHRIGAFAQDHLFDGIRRALAIVLDIPLLAVFKAMRHPHETIGERPVLHRPLVLPGACQGCDGRPVIVAVAIQDLPLLAAMVTMRDLAHHLVDLLVRFRPGVGIVDPAHPRHLLDQPLGKDRPRHRPGGAREIVHLDQLVAHRIGDAFAAIAHVDGPDPARDGIEMLFPLGIPDLHPLAFNDHARINAGLVLLVLAQVMPDMGAVGLDHFADVVETIQPFHGRVLS